MKPYYETSLGELYHGSCKDIMKQLPDNSIDSLITDPPAGISFMNKSWDSNKGGRDKWIEWLSGIMKECYRVLKPGAYGFVWAIPKTSHWTATALEDAGFEIKNILVHIFGSGFPKSLNISKQLDKIAGVERKIIGTVKTKDIRRNVKQDIKLGKTDRQGKFAPGSPSIMIEHNITEAMTPEAKLWEGYGTALKPAAENWVMVAKPNDGTYAQNALKWGVAGLNIDECRIYRNPQDKSGWSKTGNKESENKAMSGKNYARNPKIDNHSRYPSNVILDEEAGKLLDEQSGHLKTGDKNGSKRTKKTCYGEPSQELLYHKGDEGGAARFFYCAKPSVAERNAGQSSNSHATVKPLKLMEYLCTLTKTPTGGTVLDPFAGSGTTLLACEKIGREWIGIEKEEDYCEIAAKRIESEAQQLKLFVA